MTRLKPRHERFCSSFVECTNATSAAKAAGYAPQSARNAGYRLLRHPRIAARIAEMQQETAQAHCRNVDILLGKLETIYRRAVDDRHFSAAARAVELQAKLAGVGPPSTSTRGRRTAEAPALADVREPTDAGVDPLAPAVETVERGGAAQPPSVTPLKPQPR